MITKNEFPVLERDDAEYGVILPTFDDVHMNSRAQMPEKAIMAFVKERHILSFIEKHKGTFVVKHKTVSKSYDMYVFKYKGEEIVLCQVGVGAPIAAQILDWLVGHGVKKVVVGGSCGVLTEVEEGTFMIPIKALRDEGTSFKYIAPSRYIDLDKNAARSIEKTFTRLGLKYQECFTWTTDSMYRETADMIAYRKAEGCETVDMECSALAAVAKFRNIKYGQILFSADSLANIEKYDARAFGRSSHEEVLELCLEVISDF